MNAAKMNISHLAHILVTNPNFNNSQSITFNVELTVVGVVDVNNEFLEDKFWNNDNTVDVLHETLAIINRAYYKLLTDFEDKGYRAVQNASATEVENTANNMIGWTLPFEVEVPNNKISLCQ